MANFDEASRFKYCSNTPTHQDLKLGCLQRIADATELMAKDHAKLIRDLERSERARKSWMQEFLRVSKQASALRGVITKLKNKQKH